MEESKFHVSPRVIKKSQVSLQEGPAGKPASPGTLPAIRLREEDGEVKAIEVQCGCGSRIVIECQYAAKEAQK